MKKRILNFSLVFTLIIALVCSSATTVFGASVSASGGGSVTKGSTVTVSYTFSANSIIGAEASFEYDSNILQYKSCSGSIDTTGYGSAGVIKVTASGDTQAYKSITVSLTFTAINVGTSNVKLTNGFVIDFNDLSNSPVSGGSTSVTVSNPAPTVSSNANLSSLKVSAGSLSPSFSPSRTSYTVNVGEDVSVCTISATAADTDATVSVSGSKNLAEGRNVRTVTVTAPNGSKKTYTIVINRGEVKTEEPEEEQKPNEGVTATVGEIEYLVQETIKPEDIPNGFSLSLAKYDETDIPVIKDSEYKYTLALLKNQENGDVAWFFYDEANGTFSSAQSLTSEELIAFFADTVDKADKEDKDTFTIGKNELILAGILGGTLLVLIVVIIVLQVKIIKGGGKKKVNRRIQVQNDDEEFIDEEIINENKENDIFDIDTDFANGNRNHSTMEISSVIEAVENVGFGDDE